MTPRVALVFAVIIALAIASAYFATRQCTAEDKRDPRIGAALIVAGCR